MAKDLHDPKHTESAPTLKAQGLRIAIVVSRFNSLITNRLLAGALDELAKLGAKRSAITVTEVPGAFELPQAANILLRNGQYDAIISLGCVIRGETSHYDYICQSCATGLQELSLKTGVPIIFGVLTTENQKQAEARCGGEPGNSIHGQNIHGHKGRDSARTAVEMAQFAAEQNTPISEPVKSRTRNLNEAL